MSDRPVPNHLRVVGTVPPPSTILHPPETLIK